MNPLSPLLICFATEDEARPFRVLARQLRDVEIILTGVGAANATRALEMAIAEKHFAAVINAGFAGGLDPRLKTGALVSHSEDPRLLQASLAAGCAAVSFVNSDRICITPAEKRALRESSHAAAVDMESAALAAVCGKAGIPFANVRVISDAADEALPLDFNRCFTREMRLHLPRLLLELAKSPRSLSRLLEFHGAVRRCAATLATALQVMVTSLRATSARVG